MKVKHLIQQLKNLNPETEIVSWDGLVSDIMQNENELVELTLYKLKFEWYVKLCNVEDGISEMDDERLVYLKKMYRKHYHYEYDPEAHNSRTRHMYNTKKVCMVNPKASGKKSTCRAFTLEY